MLHVLRGMLILCVLVSATPGFAQAPEPPPPAPVLIAEPINVLPTPLQPGMPTPAGPILTAPVPPSLPGPPGPILTAPVPPPLPGPPMPACFAPYQDCNGPLLKGDPLLDSQAPLGWFASFELSLLAPHIKNRLSSEVTIDGFYPNTVHLPTAELCWTGSPRIELGYRLPQASGEFLVAYRSLVTSGRAEYLNFDLDGSAGRLYSALNLNVVDLDYGSRHIPLDSHWDMHWRIGARLASVFFDSEAIGMFLEQHTSNNFLGAGPHTGLDFRRTLGPGGLQLVGRIEGAAVIGRIHQSFGESVFWQPDNMLYGAAVNVSQLQVVPVLGLELGLGWAPPCWEHRCQFFLGYQFENWWYLGAAGDSKAELTLQGILLRAECRY